MTPRQVQARLQCQTIGAKMLTGKSFISLIMSYQFLVKDGTILLKILGTTGLRPISRLVTTTICTSTNHPTANNIPLPRVLRNFYFIQIYHIWPF